MKNEDGLHQSGASCSCQRAVEAVIYSCVRFDYRCGICPGARHVTAPVTASRPAHVTGGSLFIRKWVSRDGHRLMDVWGEERRADCFLREWAPLNGRGLSARPSERVTLALDVVGKWSPLLPPAAFSYFDSLFFIISARDRGTLG